VSDQDFVPAPLVAPRIDSTQWYSGASVALEIHDVVDGIRNRNWVEGGIGALGVAAEGAGLVVDPIGTLASWGVGWALEHVQPLSDILDALTGDPDQVMAYAQTWHTIKLHTTGTAHLYAGDVGKDITAWQDSAADIYRGLAQSRAHTMEGLAEAADGMSGLAEAVHMVVNAVRSGVRALISFLVGKLISWGIELAATAMAAAPLVIEQAMVAIGQTTAKVFRIVSDLLKSLKNLHDALQKYKLLITALRTGIGVGAGQYAYVPYGETP